MAEEADPVEAEAPVTPDTPEPDTDSGTQPEAGTPAEQPDTDWEKRYKDLQSEYTRTSQEAAELRQAQAEHSVKQALDNPETQDAAVQHLVKELGDDGAREWLEANGYELEDDDESDEEFHDPRVDQLLSEREQEKLDAQVQETERGMETSLDDALEAKGLKKDALTPELRDILLDAAVMRPNSEGLPDVQAVFDQWAAANEQTIKTYRAGKRNAPTPPVAGSSGTPNPSLATAQDRLAAANAIAEEAYAG